MPTDPPHEPLTARSHRGFTRLAAALLALAFGLGLVEVLARTGTINPGRDRPRPPFGRLHETERALLEERIAWVEQRQIPPSFRTFDAELGWTNRQGTHGPDREHHLNSLGARGAREYAAAPPPGVLRLACFGESFVYGTEVQEDESWPAWIERLDAQVEAINLGVPAYGTDQALLRFRRQGRHGAQVAVLGILLENIARNVNRYRPLYANDERLPCAKPRFVLEEGELVLVPLPFTDELELWQAALDGSILTRLAKHEYWAEDRSFLPGSAFFDSLAARDADRRRIHKELWLARDEAYEVTRALARQFDAEARAAGAERVVVLVFPSRNDLAYPLADGAPYWQPFLDELDASGVECMDAADVLRGPFERGEPVYAQHHLSVTGNRLVAEALLARLVDSSR